MGEFAKKKHQIMRQEKEKEPFFSPKMKLFKGKSDVENGPLLNLNITIPEPVINRNELGISAIFYFDKNHFFLDYKNIVVLQQLCQEIQLMLEPVVIINGHASTEGKNKDNQTLSEHRRNMVMAIINSNKGISTIKFEGKAYGETQPIAPETGKNKSEKEAQRRLNRRVEVCIMLPPSAIKTKEKEDEKKKQSIPGLDRPLKFEDLSEELIEKWKWEEFWKVPPVTPPPGKSIQELVEKKLKDVVQHTLSKLGIHGKTNDFLTDKIVEGIKKGGEKALDVLLDQNEMTKSNKDAIKKAIEAGMKSKVIH